MGVNVGDRVVPLQRRPKMRSFRPPNEEQHQEENRQQTADDTPDSQANDHDATCLILAKKTIGG
jgi:hypothetical protein